MISVQTDDFDMAQAYNWLRRHGQSDGAIVTFTGLVRDFNQQGQVQGMVLEHYPGMTEKALQSIVDKVREKWHIGAVHIIHRVGELTSDDQIVFVGVTSAHRESAFQAAQCIMDYLKTEAPFWKQEITANGAVWVEAKQSDQKARLRWDN